MEGRTVGGRRVKREDCGGKVRNDRRVKEVELEGQDQSNSEALLQSSYQGSQVSSPTAGVM